MPARKKRKSTPITSLEELNRYIERFKKMIDATPRHTGRNRRITFMRDNARAIMDQVNHIRHSYESIMEASDKDVDTEDITSWSVYVAAEMKWRKFEEFCMTAQDLAEDADDFGEFYGSSAEDAANAKRNQAKSKKRPRANTGLPTPADNPQNTVSLKLFVYSLPLALGSFPPFSSILTVFNPFFPVFYHPFLLFIPLSPHFISFVFVWLYRDWVGLHATLMCRRNRRSASMLIASQNNSQIRLQKCTFV